MATTTILLARHGNTFESGETPRRIGARTDLPLTEKGREQAAAIGRYIAAHGYRPDYVFTSALQRTIRTAALAMEAADMATPSAILPFLSEIDYGPDEDKPEDHVIARIGEPALNDWEANGIMPPGWSPSPDTIIAGWRDFAKNLLADRAGECVLVVTSNGIARFAQHLCSDPASMAAAHGLKMATGALSILTHDGAAWSIGGWNIRPDKV